MIKQTVKFIPRKDRDGEIQRRELRDEGERGKGEKDRRAEKEKERSWGGGGGRETGRKREIKRGWRAREGEGKQLGRGGVGGGEFCVRSSGFSRERLQN